MRIILLLLGLFGCSGVKFDAVKYPVIDPEVASMVSANDVFMKQKQMLLDMLEDYPKVEVEAFWFPCGEENSYYFYRSQRIVLCTEMSNHPGAAIFFAAHEMGHAVGHQYTSTTEEIEADELAALAMIKHGYLKELFEAAEYHSKEPTQGHIPGDPHPSNGFRAWYLTCLAEGSMETTDSVECITLYEATKLKWEVRLADKEAE